MLSKYDFTLLFIPVFLAVGLALTTLPQITTPQGIAAGAIPALGVMFESMFIKPPRGDRIP